MNMDGYEILVGDSVHDIVFGEGRVTRLVSNENRFWVSYGGDSLRSYDINGVGNFKGRTLYWRDPVLVPPNKDGDSWDKIVKITNAVSKSLGLS